MQYLFDLLYLLPALVYAPVFFVKSRRAGESPALLFSERWGCLAQEKIFALQGKRILWIHAVSVGEVMVARRWIEAMRDQESLEPFHFVLTTVTPTGQKLARQSEADDLTAIYVPFDFSFCVKSFLKKINPEALVLVETEIWPNLILISAQRKLPIFLINARLSEKSLKGYRRVLKLFQPVFSAITRIFSQDEMDAERFHALGIPNSKIETAGNIKFDAGVGRETPEQFSREHFSLPPEDQVWIAGSTHPGEEEKILQVFARLRPNNPHLRLILAPRHVERAEALAREVAKQSFCFQMWSQFQKEFSWDVLVVDQIGVLKNIYALGNFVFMGGSWVQHGGQNPIEPAVFHLPVLHGRHIFNFKQVYQILDSAHAAFCVEDAEACFQKVEFFLKNSEVTIEAGRQAGAAVNRYRGASALQARRVTECLKVVSI